MVCRWRILPQGVLFLLCPIFLLAYCGRPVYGDKSYQKATIISNWNYTDMENCLNLIQLLEDGCVSSQSVSQITQAVVQQVIQEISEKATTSLLPVSNIVEKLLDATQYLVKHNKGCFPHLEDVGYLDVISSLLEVLLTNGAKESEIDEWKSLIELTVETSLAVSDMSSQAKSAVVLKILPEILPVLGLNKLTFICRLEILKTINTILEQCHVQTKEEFLKDSDNQEVVKSLISLIQTVGDYEFQVGTVECLMRLFPRKSRKLYADMFISDKYVHHGFLNIKDKDFETDCRHFLNVVNAKSEDPNQGVYSIPCLTVYIGKKELRKPSDVNYSEFWVDFNIGSQRVTIFCEQDSLMSQTSNMDDDMWETVAIYKSDVQTCSCSVEEDHMIQLEIELKSPVCDLYPSQHQDVTDNKIRVEFDIDLEMHVTHAVAQTFSFAQKISKVSTVEKPLHISIKEVELSDSQSMTSVPQTVTSRDQSARDSVCSQESTSTSTSRKHKISVPSVPMCSPLVKQKPEKSKKDSSPCEPIQSRSDITSNKMKAGQKQEQKAAEKASKDFAVPKTPLQKYTRSKGKVKTPIVMLKEATSKQADKPKEKKKKQHKDDSTGVTKDERPASKPVDTEVIPESQPVQDEEVTVLKLEQAPKVSKSIRICEDSGIGEELSTTAIQEESFSKKTAMDIHKNSGQKEGEENEDVPCQQNNRDNTTEKFNSESDSETSDVIPETFDDLDNADTLNASCKMQEKKKENLDQILQDMQESFGFDTINGDIDSIPDSYDTDKNSEIQPKSVKEIQSSKRTRSKQNKKGMHKKEHDTLQWDKESSKACMENFKNLESMKESKSNRKVATKQIKSVSLSNDYESLKELYDFESTDKPEAQLLDTHSVPGITGNKKSNSETSKSKKVNKEIEDAQPKKGKKKRNKRVTDQNENFPLEDKAEVDEPMQQVSSRKPSRSKAKKPMDNKSCNSSTVDTEFKVNDTDQEKGHSEDFTVTEVDKAVQEQPLIPTKKSSRSRKRKAKDAEVVSQQDESESKLMETVKETNFTQQVSNKHTSRTINSKSKKVSTDRSHLHTTKPESDEFIVEDPHENIQNNTISVDEQILTNATTEPGENSLDLVSNRGCQNEGNDITKSKAKQQSVGDTTKHKIKAKSKSHKGSNDTSEARLDSIRFKNKDSNHLVNLDEKKNCSIEEKSKNKNTYDVRSLDESLLDSDCLYIEEDDTYNARRYRQEVAQPAKSSKKESNNGHTSYTGDGFDDEENLKGYDGKSSTDETMPSADRNIHVKTTTLRSKGKRVKADSTLKNKKMNSTLNETVDSDNGVDDFDNPAAADTMKKAITCNKVVSKDKGLNVKEGSKAKKLEKERNHSKHISKGKDGINANESVSVSYTGKVGFKDTSGDQHHSNKSQVGRKCESMVFQMSYSKSRTSYRSYDWVSETQVKKEPSYDPYDFEAQWENASMQSDRNKKGVASLEKNKKSASKKKNKKENRSQFSLNETINDEEFLDTDENCSKERGPAETVLVQDKETKRWYRKNKVPSQTTSDKNSSTQSKKTHQKHHTTPVESVCYMQDNTDENLKLRVEETFNIDEPMPVANSSSKVKSKLKSMPSPVQDTSSTDEDLGPREQISVDQQPVSSFNSILKGIMNGTRQNEENNMSCKSFLQTPKSLQMMIDEVCDKDDSPTEITKTPCLAALSARTPKLGSSSRGKGYRPLNVCVIKTPQSVAISEKLGTDSEKEEIQSTKKSGKRPKRKRKSTNYIELSNSDTDGSQSLETSRPGLASSLSCETSLNTTAQGDRSWICNKNKNASNKDSIKKYKEKKSRKPCHSKSHSTEMSVDDKEEITEDEESKSVNLEICSLPMPSFKSCDMVSMPVTPAAGQSGQCDFSLDDLILSPVTPYKATAPEDDIQVLQTQEKYTVSLNLSDTYDQDFENYNKMMQQQLNSLLGDSGFASGFTMDYTNTETVLSESEENCLEEQLNESPSSELRPSRSTLKRKFPVEMEESELSSAESESQSEKETSTFIPKKLFQSGIEDRIKKSNTAKAMSVYSDQTEETTELDFPCQTGVSAFLATFGADIQKQFKAKRQRLEALTKDTLKATHGQIKHALTNQFQQQSMVQDDYMSKIMIELCEMSKDVDRLKEAENKTEDFYNYQLSVLKANEQSQRLRMEKMRKAHTDYRGSVSTVRKHNHGVQKALLDQLKQGMTSLQNKLLRDVQKQELMNVRRGLQNLF